MLTQKYTGKEPRQPQRQRGEWYNQEAGRSFSPRAYGEVGSRAPLASLFPASRSMTGSFAVAIHHVYVHLISRCRKIIYLLISKHELTLH